MSTRITRSLANQRFAASDRDGNAFFRFAPFLNSAWSYHCARKLACGTPCFIGLTPRCFAHSARASCAPRLRLRGVPALRPPFGRVLAPPAASRPSIAHYASLRVLGTSALRAFTFLQAFAEKNTRNDVHAVISDLSLVLPILCQCSVAHALPWEWACACISAPDEGHIRA